MSSTITNLEQVRAAHALAVTRKLVEAKESAGDSLSGYHSLIITNGLLAALSFSFSKKDGQHPIIAEAMLAHLAELQGAGLFPGDAMGNSAKERMEALIYMPAHLLAVATDECMAYLAFLKRFVRAESPQQESN